MYGTNLLSHQDRLEIVFRIKLEQLQNVIIGKYNNIKRTDILNLISDLIEIRENLEGTQLRLEHMK
jgi:hypothetical protein